MNGTINEKVDRQKYHYRLSTPYGISIIEAGYSRRKHQTQPKTQVSVLLNRICVPISDSGPVLNYLKVHNFDKNLLRWGEGQAGNFIKKEGLQLNPYLK